ncbi:MAG TPA: hypothetical protein VF821_00115 [Lentzea sp.]
MTRGGSEGRGALRPARFFLMSALALTVGACSTGADDGADNPRAAVDSYFAAMNGKDAASLRKVVGEYQHDAVAEHLSSSGGKGLAVESVDITQEFGPNFANAHVTGKYADRSPYDERIVVSKRNNRWYVSIPGPIPVRTRPS